MRGNADIIGVMNGVLAVHRSGLGRPLTPEPPSWTTALLQRVAAAASDHEPAGGGPGMSHRGPLAMRSVRIEGAAHLDTASLKQAVSSAYGDIRQTLAALRRHPIRFWNFVPSINGAMDGGLERYMVFNQGRFDAYSQWYGTSRAFEHSLATASAVGVPGSDLVIYCLAADAPGDPIENPRQTPAWKYSSSYGPRPPCFARATRVTLEDRHLLLVGGTASIVGEQSLHRGDPVAQTKETLANLERLIATASGGGSRSRVPLEQLIDIRVHVARQEDAAVVTGLIEPRCPRATVDVVSAGLCRPELLVEIEGVAEL